MEVPAMLCAKCGAANTDTAIVCRNCSALLGVAQGSYPTKSNPPVLPFAGSSWNVGRLPVEQPPTFLQTPQAQRTQAAPPDQSWFAPVAHSPFSDVPLPQSSQPLPALIPPAGEIKSFNPARQFASPARM